jgi:CelD/BcsL family acetyltransferase involved in cellulose biosynthesis
MSLAVRKTYRVERVNTETELLALKEPWTALLTDIPDVPIFLTWEWVSTWWRRYGQDRALWVLTAWDDAGRLVGLVPWMRVCHHLGPLCLRRIAFAGSWFTYRVHLDVIARPDEKEAVCAAFLAYLDTHRKEWDVLDLEGLAQDSVLKRHLATAKGLYRERKALICPFTPLPGDWDTYQMNSLSAKKRRNLSYRRRRLERDHSGQVVFHRVTEADELPQAMDSLGALNRKRWHAEDLATSFDNSCFVAFHREMAALALQRGWLCLYQLKVADQVIAASYGFRYRDVFYGYQTGFDLDWGRYSPGRLIIAHVIQEAIKEQAHELDMLGGVYEHKFSWTDKARVEPHLSLSTNWRGHLWSVGAALFDVARFRGRKVLPQALLQRINRFLSARRQ